jgi:DNA polymerase I-like protein with 3'-5' exonuclease and polymerase domains
VAYNTPVQGGAAEAMLAALAHLRGLAGSVTDATPVAVVHDELVVEAAEAENEAELVARLVERSMEEGMLVVFPDAATEGLVQARVVRSWAKK